MKYSTTIRELFNTDMGNRWPAGRSGSLRLLIHSSELAHEDETE
jgi:hypothetical protein